MSLASTASASATARAPNGPARQRALAQAALLASACGLGGCRQNATSAPTRAPEARAEAKNAAPTAGTPKADAPEGREAIAVVPSSRPALFVRLGDALLPLACVDGGAWRAGKDCVGSDRDQQIALHPRFTPGPFTASPARIPFTASDSTERGLALNVDATKPGAEQPLLGFGVARSEAVVRFTERAAQRIADDAKSFCGAPERACAALEVPVAATLPSAEWRAEEARDAMTQVRQLIAHLTRQPVAELSAAYVVNMGGEPQRIFQLEVEAAELLKDATAQRASGDLLELPERVYYLMIGTPGGLRRLNVTRSWDFGLGETGELVAAVDLDGDGTDELILEWSYSEGRTWELVHRRGDGLVVVGSFGEGA